MELDEENMKKYEEKWFVNLNVQFSRGMEENGDTKIFLE